MTRRLFGVFLAGALACGLGGSGALQARAEDAKEPGAVLDKAIKAMGGEEALGKVKAGNWKAKGKLSIMGSDVEFTTDTTYQGIDRVHSEFDGDFGGMKVHAVLVVDGDKGWRVFGEKSALDKDALASEKRNAFISASALSILPLKNKDLKLEALPEEKVEGKNAVGIKVTPPAGKEIKIYFDAESGLPVKLVAEILGFDGAPFVQETRYSGYKELGGIKKATKLEFHREGMKFMEQEVTEFKPLESVDAKTFAEP